MQFVTQKLQPFRELRLYGAREHEKTRYNYRTINQEGGYNAMLEKIEPSKIICFGTPFSEMDGNIIAVDYAESRKVVR